MVVSRCNRVLELVGGHTILSYLRTLIKSRVIPLQSSVSPGLLTAPDNIRHTQLQIRRFYPLMHYRLLMIPHPAGTHIHRIAAGVTVFVPIILIGT
jgi:hypothetical protein